MKGRGIEQDIAFPITFHVSVEVNTETVCCQTAFLQFVQIYAHFVIENVNIDDWLLRAQQGGGPEQYACVGIIRGLQYRL